MNEFFRNDLVDAIDRYEATLARVNGGNANTPELDTAANGVLDAIGRFFATIVHDEVCEPTVEGCAEAFTHNGILYAACGRFGGDPGSTVLVRVKRVHQLDGEPAAVESDPWRIVAAAEPLTF